MKISETIRCINAVQELVQELKYNIDEFDFEVNGQVFEAINSNSRLLLSKRTSTNDPRLKVFIDYKEYLHLDAWDRFLIYDKFGKAYELSSDTVFHLMLENDHLLEFKQINNLVKVSNKIDAYEIKIYLNH